MRVSGGRCVCQLVYSYMWDCNASVPYMWASMTDYILPQMIGPWEWGCTLALSNLVPRFSVLCLPWRQRWERAWERGCDLVMALSGDVTPELKARSITRNLPSAQFVFYGGFLEEIMSGPKPDIVNKPSSCLKQYENDEIFSMIGRRCTVRCPDCGSMPS